MSSRICRGFYALPVDFIANALSLSLTSPKEACRLSSVAFIFRSAADSDVVWERLLPTDYRDIISRSIDGADSLLSRFHSKKELYFYLCGNPVLIDGGTKSFSLDKETGKKCFMLAERDLFIEWGGTPQYWKEISLPESRFIEVFFRFEVRGKINASMLSSGTNYSAYLVFNTNSRYRGFDYKPAESLVGISGHDAQRQTLWLVQSHEPIDPNTEYPKLRTDEWMEVELGVFLVEGNQDSDVEISLMGMKGGNWNGGLIIQGIEIRPKAP